MQDVSRRAFLAGVAGLGSAMIASGCAQGTVQSASSSAASSAAEASASSAEVKDAYDGTVKATLDMSSLESKVAFCKMCGPARTHCLTRCYLKDGRWTYVEGAEEWGNNYGPGSKTLCAKGNAAMQVLYSPQRILYPMKRTGEKGVGESAFERITWDEAIQEIAAKLKEQKEQYGPESLGILSPQFYAVLGNVGRRFLNVHGSPNYMHSALCNSQRVFSRLNTIGGPNHGKAANTAPGQLDKTKLLIVWGYNPENSAVNQGVPYKRMDAKEKGLTIVDIRPTMEGLGAKADYWLGLRPGTDGALALAFLNVIIENDLYDHDFVDNWCNGFDQLAEHVKQFTPAWAAEITGISEDVIVEVGKLMGTTKPMGINIGNGIGDQDRDGYWTVASVCLIEAITGNMDIAGGGGAGMVMPDPMFKTKPIDYLADRMPKSEEDEANGWMAGVSKLVAPETPRWYQTELTQESGPTTAYYFGLMSILTEDPYPLRCVIGQSSNPLSATRNPKQVVEALKKLEYYVVMDTNWNSSCDFADIVLPAATQYETSDQFATKNTPKATSIAINQQIAEPMGESMSDWKFYLDLAVAMGYGDDFWGGDLDAMLSDMLEPSGITLEELREKGIISVERPEADAKPKEPEYQNYEKMFAILPNGKVQCYNEWIGGKPNTFNTGENSYLPEYVGPAESHASTPDIAKEYPLAITDVHAYRLCNHSYYHDVPYLREKQPNPWVKMNPATAKEYGIAEGDWVKIESPHGHVKMVARLAEGIAPDVLMSKRGWWEACEELDLPGYDYLDGGAEINVLYSAELANTDPFHSAIGKQTLVKISKAEG